jgi:hypothetical protein
LEEVFNGSHLTIKTAWKPYLEVLKNYEKKYIMLGM